MLIQTIFSPGCSSRATYILTMVSVGCLFVDRLINLSKILTPGGSVLALKILPSLIYFMLSYSLPRSLSKQFS